MIHHTDGLLEAFEVFKMFEDNNKSLDFEKGIL